MREKRVQGGNKKGQHKYKFVFWVGEPRSKIGVDAGNGTQREESIQSKHKNENVFKPELEAQRYSLR